MNFHVLNHRLVAELQSRVRSGALTERGLARICGLSQPHVHNVLKGKRAFSPPMADQILHYLRLSLLDLIEVREMEEYLQKKIKEKKRYREVPALEGCLGPGYPYPARESPNEGFAFPCAFSESAAAPAAVRLGPDRALEGLFMAGDLLLLDRSELACVNPDPQAYYAINLRGQGLLRRVTREDGGVRLLAGIRKLEWIPAGAGELLTVVRARAIALFRTGVRHIPPIYFGGGGMEE